MFGGESRAEDGARRADFLCESLRLDFASFAVVCRFNLQI